MRQSNLSKRSLSTARRKLVNVRFQCLYFLAADGEFASQSRRSGRRCLSMLPRDAVAAVATGGGCVGPVPSGGVSSVDILMDDRTCRW